MVQKKELIVKLLEKLKWHRNMSENLIILVNSSYCTQELIDSIMNKINVAIKMAKKDADKNALKKWLTLIQKIRQKEEEQGLSPENLESEFDKLLKSI